MEAIGGPRDVDSEAVSAVIALLQEANTPIGNVRGAAVATIATGTSFVKTVPTRRECLDFANYISLARELPGQEAVAFEKLYFIIDTEHRTMASRTMVNMSRTCNGWATQKMKDIEVALHAAVIFCEGMVQQLSIAEIDNLNKQLGMVMDVKYASEEVQNRNPAFKKAVDAAQGTLDTLRNEASLNKGRADQIASALITFKIDTYADRRLLEGVLPLKMIDPIFTIPVADIVVQDQMLHGNPHESAYYRGTHLPMMADAIAAAKNLCEFFLRQAAYYDKIALYLLIARRGIGMISVQNRRTYVSAGSSGAMAKLKEFKVDVEELQREIPPGLFKST